jgi:hypothetical protein
MIAGPGGRRLRHDVFVGYPMVNMRDIESGKVRATRDLFGVD